MIDNLFYYLGKFLWSLVAPGNALVLCVVCGAGLALLRPAGRLRCFGRWLLGAGLAALVLIMLVPLGYWGMAVLEERIPQPATLPAEVAGIIAIGGSESEHIAAVRGADYASFGTMNRLFVLTLLAKKYPQAMVMYAGGSTRVQPHVSMRQADIAAKVLAVMLPQRTVLYERESRTTYENALNAAAMLGDKRKQPWILVTSAAHMPRSLGTFRQQGWNVIPMPADYRTEGVFKPLMQFDFMHNLVMLELFLREVCGMIGYYYGGKSDALFPRMP
jgi:uncharacterized SAM-binding protein YcdF (DUF218 family)